MELGRDSILSRGQVESIDRRTTKHDTLVDDGERDIDTLQRDVGGVLQRRRQRRLDVWTVAVASATGDADVA